MSDEKQLLFDGLSVNSEPIGDGIYVVRFSAGPDRTWILPLGQTIKYAMAVLAAVNAAEIDAALFAVLMRMKHAEATPDDAARAIGHFRQMRGEVSWPPDSPIRMSPAVAAADARPFLIVHVDGQPHGQLEARDARDHAMGVLDSLLSSELDTQLHAYLAGTVLPALGIPEAHRAAQTVIDHIGDLRRVEAGPR